jgi:hypothetical protein
MQIFKAAPGMIKPKVPASAFRVKIATSEPLKRVTEGIFKSVSYFTEADKKFTIQYLKQKF